MEGTLVLGGTGFLGAWVAASAHGAARRLATFAEPQGSPVWGVGRRPADAPRFSDPRDGVRWESLDLEQEADLGAWLGKRAPACIIQCAALSRVADCAADPQRAELLNATVPGRVASWCAESGARLVQISTDMVFDGEAPEGGYREDGEPRPLSVYGRTKWEGERAVLEACPEALVLRLPLLYGNSGGRGLGASDSLLTQIDRGEEPALFVDEWRTPLEVSNAAEAILELAEGSAQGLLHLAGPDRLSRYDLGQAVLRAMGLPADEAAACVRAVPREDLGDAQLNARPRDTSLCSKAARALLSTELLGVRPGTRRAVS